MNNKEKKVAPLKKEKPSKPEVKRISTEIKEQAINLFTLQSDEIAQTQARKRREREKQIVQFINGTTINIDEYILEVMAKHETRFHKEWFYKLADLYKVDRKLMDNYVKPTFVRLFIINFIYARFPYMLLRTLRSRNRKMGSKAGKLHQHLRKDAVEKLEITIKQVYDTMDEIINDNGNPLDFKMKYSSDNKLFFQQELEFLN